MSVPKGKTLLLRRTPGHSLVLEYDVRFRYCRKQISAGGAGGMTDTFLLPFAQGRKLGEVQDPVIARELFLAYFADIDPISKTVSALTPLSIPQTFLIPIHDRRLIFPFNSSKKPWLKALRNSIDRPVAIKKRDKILISLKLTGKSHSDLYDTNVCVPIEKSRYHL